MTNAERSGNAEEAAVHESAAKKKEASAEIAQVFDHLPRLLDQLTGRIPALVSAIREGFYSPEAGRNLGKAVGGFYQELLAAGVPSDVALDMTKTYLAQMGRMGIASPSRGFTS